MKEKEAPSIEQHAYSIDPEEIELLNDPEFMRRP